MNTQATEARRLLVVDDDQVVIATLADGFRYAGYHVIEALSGEEGLRLAAEARPDLALLDVRMPGMPGLDLARRLRDEFGVPFMFLSAYGDVQVAREAAECGALGYLVKPLAVAQIIPSVESALARAAEIRKLRETEAQLGTALASGRETSMAVGVLMERHRLDRNEAFNALRDQARIGQRKVSDFAAQVLASIEIINAPRRKPGRTK